MICLQLRNYFPVSFCLNSLQTHQSNHCIISCSRLKKSAAENNGQWVEMLRNSCGRGQGGFLGLEVCASSHVTSLILRHFAQSTEVPSPITTCTQLPCPRGSSPLASAVKFFQSHFHKQRRVQSKGRKRDSCEVSKEDLLQCQERSWLRHPACAWDSSDPWKCGY